MAETIRFLSVPEIVSLFRAIKAPRDRALFLIAYRHGLRASEVGMLRGDDVDLADSRLTIRRLKGSLGGVHPMQGDELRLLRRHLGCGRRDALRVNRPHLPIFCGRGAAPISRRMLDVLMKKYCEAAGIPPVKAHFHCLKHSIATHLLEAGMGVEAVRDWLGHKNIENTLIYAKLSSASLDAAAGRALSKLPRF